MGCCDPPPKKEKPPEAAPAPQFGPGAELKAILNQMGAMKYDGCQCPAWVSKMNRWGVAGCKEHFDEIVAHLADERSKVEWRRLISMGRLAVIYGLPVTIRGLVKQAIARAEAWQSEPSQSS